MSLQMLTSVMAEVNVKHHGKHHVLSRHK